MSRKRLRVPPSSEEVQNSYIDWINNIGIIPSFPYRNSYRSDYNAENPDAKKCSVYPSEINKLTSIRLIGRGTTGRSCRKSHTELVCNLKSQLTDPALLTKVMELSQTEFAFLYFFNRLGMLSDTRYMKRSSEDSVSKTLSMKMRMVGLQFFLVKMLVTSTHKTNFSMRKQFARNFFSYMLKGFCKNEFKQLGYQTGRMRRNYNFQFPSETDYICLPAYRLNFQNRFTILTEYSRQLNFAIKFLKFTKFVCQIPLECRSDFYDNSNDLPNHLNQESVALVQSVRQIFFKRFADKNVLSECCNREYIRKVLGLLIGTSEQKIESAIVELFDSSFSHSSKTNHPSCFSTAFSLLEKCDSLDTNFFDLQVQIMLSESLACSNTNNLEAVLLMKKRSAFQNILLFVIYSHKRRIYNHNFLSCLNHFLSFILESI